MTTKQVAEICGVTESTVTRNAPKVGVVLENGKSHDWTEDELKKLQLALVSNSMNRGNASTKSGIVEGQAMQACKGYLSLQAIAQSGNVEAMQEYMQQMVDYTKAQHELLLAQEQNRLLLEQKEEAERAFLEEKEDNEKNKELVRHKYLSATEVKDKVHELTGKWVVVSKAVKRIPLDENDVLYKPFTNNGYTGQTKVYHPSVVDKIAESLY